MKYQVYLILQVGEKDNWKQIRNYPMENICILLGRNKKIIKPENGDILIDDSICDASIYRKISSVHLSFYRRGTTEKDCNDSGICSQRVQGYAVKDGYGNNPSTNGTLLNGFPLKEKINLKHGDILQITKELRVIYQFYKLKDFINENYKDTITG